MISSMLVLALYVAASGASGPAAERVPTLEPAHVQRLLWASRDLFDTNVHAIVRCRPEGATAPRFRLAYLPCRNRCEVPRLLLEEAGCAYDVIRPARASNSASPLTNQKPRFFI